MKQQILNLKKKLLIVELPEGATDVHINDLVYKNKVSFRTNTSLHFIETKENLLGESPKLVGKLTDITEEQFQNWVEKFYNGGVRDYREGSFDPADDLANFFLTAKESFFSYLEKEGIYFESKMMEPTKEKWGYLNSKWTWDEGEFHYNNELKIYRELHEAWKLENCYIFEII
jgi:hypothetical protein